MTEKTNNQGFLSSHLNTWAGIFDTCLVVDYFTRVTEAVLPQLKLGTTTAAIKDLVGDVATFTYLNDFKSDSIDLINELTGVEESQRMEDKKKAFSAAKKSERVFFSIMGFIASSGGMLAIAKRVSLVVLAESTSLLFTQFFLIVDVARVGVGLATTAVRAVMRNHKIQVLQAKDEMGGAHYQEAVEKNKQWEKSGVASYEKYLKQKNSAAMWKMAKQVAYLSIVAIQLCSGMFVYAEAASLVFEGVYLVTEFTQSYQSKDAKALKEKVELQLKSSHSEARVSA